MLDVERSAFAAKSAVSPREFVLWQTYCRRSVNTASSIVSLDWPFDNLGFLNEKFGQILFYVVRS